MNTKTDVYDYIVNNPDSYTVFKLTAPWCGPCRRVQPSFKRLMSGKYINTNTFDLNVDNEDADPDCTIQQMMDELELRKIPHFFICHGGEMVASIQTSNPDTLESFLDEYLPQ
jgi:thioredoxin-like negative regulator of GroEL